MHRYLPALMLIASLGLVGFGCESQSSHEATGSEHKQMDGHEGSASKHEKDKHEGSATKQEHEGSGTKQDDAGSY